jgi:RNA polymerase subunit RPABC4/transcription elongation factor Spt4
MKKNWLARNLTKKACPECHLISLGSICPNCKAKGLSDDYSGLVIIFDPESSVIANAMEIQKKGYYALRVR